MPKMKSRSCARKRFEITANGHLKRKQANMNHILNKKSRKTKRKLAKSALVFKGVEKKIRTMIEV